MEDTNNEEFTFQMKNGTQSIGVIKGTQCQADKLVKIVSAKQKDFELVKIEQRIMNNKIIHLLNKMGV